MYQCLTAGCECTAAVNLTAEEVSSSILSLLIAGGVLTGTYPADLKLVCASTWLCMHQQKCQQAQWVLVHKQPVLNAVLFLS